MPPRRRAASPRRRAASPRRAVSPARVAATPPARVKRPRAPPPPRVSAKHVAVAQYVAACLAFVVVGPVLILLNNDLLRERGFPYPIGLSAVGVSFAALLSRAAYACGAVRFTRPELLSSWAFFARTSVPTGALAAATLALGNASYVYLTVATCTILKSLTPAMTLGVLYGCRLEEPSARTVGCVALITAGTVVATRGSLALSRLGVALQLGANLAEATRVVLSQQLLASMRLPLLEMQYHVAPVQLGCLLLASLALELNTPVHRAAALGCVLGEPRAFLAAGCLGLFLQISGLLVIKVAGSVAVKLLAIARGAVLVLYEVSASGGAGELSAVQLGGYAASLAGFALYNLFRGVEAAPRPRRKGVRTK